MGMMMRLLLAIAALFVAPAAMARTVGHGNCVARSASSKATPQPSPRHSPFFETAIAPVTKM